MKRTMVRYKVKPELVAENEQYITNVFAQLKREQLQGLRYTTYKLDDGVSFMHLVSLDTTDGNNPLVALAAFKAFSAGIQERCTELPVFVELQEIGSYDGLGA